MLNPRTKRSRAALAGASALAVAALLPAAVSAAAGPSQGSAAGKAPLTLKSVKIVDEGTVDTVFSNPMDPKKLAVEQFQAPHYYWVIPHTHIAVGYKLLNGDRTVRTVLDRGLHPTKGRCDGAQAQNDPRCSIDTLNWEVVGATDIYGQTITNKDWKVWTPVKAGGIGAKKHPGPCRPGCP